MSKTAKVYFLAISLFLVGLVYWGSWVIQVQNETRQAERLRLQQQEIERLKNEIERKKQEQQLPVAPTSEQRQQEGEADGQNKKTSSSKPACASTVKDIHARYERNLGAIQSEYRRNLHSIQNDKGSENNKSQAAGRLKDTANRNMDKAYSIYLSEIRSSNCGSAPQGPPQHY